MDKIIEDAMLEAGNLLEYPIRSGQVYNSKMVFYDYLMEHLPDEIKENFSSDYTRENSKELIKRIIDDLTVKFEKEITKLYKGVNTLKDRRERTKHFRILLTTNLENAISRINALVDEGASIEEILEGYAYPSDARPSNADDRDWAIVGLLILLLGIGSYDANRLYKEWKGKKEEEEKKNKLINKPKKQKNK